MSAPCTRSTRPAPTAVRAAGSLALLACLTTVTSGAASAGTAPLASPRSGATTTVTIKAQGVDLSGTVASTRRACVTDRKVLVFQQIGARGGGDDVRRFSDLASSDGSWDTGNTGEAGKFYAKVKATTTCGGDTSPTVRATR